MLPKTELPWEQIRLLKKHFLIPLVLTFLDQRKSYLNTWGHWKCHWEEGTVPVTDQNGEQINSFVRVTDVKSPVSQTINELIESGSLKDVENLGPDTLGLPLAGDKGSDTTRLLVEVLNTFECQSIRNAKLVGIYEGKETRESIEAVCGKLIRDMLDLASEIESFKLRSHNVCSNFSPMVEMTINA